MLGAAVLQPGVPMLILLVAAAGTFFFSSLLLRPLRRLRTVAAGIAGDEDLDRRVPVDDGPGELRALAASFDAMLTRLGRSSADRERALEATRRFAADAGHELRTPLTSVQANLSALRRHPELPEERRAELLDDALSEQRRLVALLDGLQTLARGDAAQVQHTRVDLAELLDVALEAARARHPATRWALDAPEQPVEVTGWEPGLRVMLDNLVENAARHGRAAGTVRVALADAVGGGAVLTVEDDGPGIAPKNVERMLQRGVRGDERVQGHGIGLAIVQDIVRAYRGELTIGKSAELEGAKISIRIPPVF